ncbi:L-serine ammonia-lyase [Alteromonas mediterranea]|jgi:L-serine dehydratase|uniref:L-serine dehydratase n=1 Tax=Alteromonas mediterranea TaxID=314275 RepID=A0AAC8XJY7_9ALTE|nr:L-serine ammonia-lyase [Alteromonas mediterranea]MBR9895848.1 L-serine ammonia-lyase [Gammaproteobacteria bacterium]AFV85628.1 L-serine dehydratase 1 [Alteromonas mediterranea DE1]AGP85714.1 L-serine dehydratase 1 [Alteromonas mediterranea U4]AGP89873.1 L-serine dehydratase 1 [Alteromonas mediterranea U7]AGP97640.1 L-serine dehydratase 1 [Alteromonas mediterranea UM7]|tara:strand:- start:51 stop:1424 length:1374 start_codon:yes stop_codon:yes gene_type:complete
MISVFDMFSVGIGPSSSHTVGPMKAGAEFVGELAQDNALFETVDSVKVELFGSLGQTGIGHGTGKAVILGLLGELPDMIDVDSIESRLEEIRNSEQLRLNGQQLVRFPNKNAIIFHRRKSLPKHANALTFYAYAKDALVKQQTYYSIGGGFIIKDEDFDATKAHAATLQASVPFPFKTAEELLALCKTNGLSISSLMLRNESTFRSKHEVKQQLHNIWLVMKACIQRGIESEGILPGGLKVVRRAPGLYRRLQTEHTNDPMQTMDWVNLFALAVNEENAAGGRVVTAPTNGAAGIIPAVLQYVDKFIRPVDEEVASRFLLTAGAIGILYKENASISGAEVGCQGEVGVACSMAAGALAEIMGGTAASVENAAEIGMEHNLGLTCDPVGGLVQVPCIERNAMGAIKAINASRLALRGTGDQKVSLDKVIKTMRDTGNDMKTKYKETARGGLAVNIIEC